MDNDDLASTGARVSRARARQAAFEFQRADFTQHGVKTGTTNRAGSNLVSAARDPYADVIAVILGSNENGSSSGDRYSDSRKLLNFGLNNAAP